jgi:hypothetical protein
MNRVSEVIGVMVAAILFGLALSTLSPFPYADSIEIFLVSSIAYIFAFIALRKLCGPLPILVFGFATFICFLIGWLWYWFGVMDNGWWHPPVIPLVQSFYSVSGESAYDADSANLGFLIWVLFMIAYASYHLTSGASRTQFRSCLATLARCARRYAIKEA